MSYIFYFEINSNNINQICSKLPFSKKWSGFDWTNAMTANPNNCYQKPETTYPIKAVVNTNPSSSSDIRDGFLTNDYKIGLVDLEIPENSFIENGWNGVSSSASFTYSCACPSLTDNFPNPKNLVFVSGTSDTKTTKSTSYTISNLTCSGEDCRTWFPPLDQNAEIPLTAYLANTSLNAPKTLACYNNNNSEPLFMGLKCSGSIKMVFNILKPLSYNKPPNVVNNIYQPNVTTIKGGFYISSIFKGNLRLIKNQTSSSSNENVECSCDPSTTSSDENIIYSVSYSISKNDFMNKNFVYHLQDFLYLQQYLYSISSSSFQKSIYGTSTLDNLQQLIIDYCSISGNMNENVCSSTFLPFVLLFPNGSPCLNPTQNCSKGWDSYCFTENNIDSDECLQYYNQNYIGNSENDTDNLLLNDSIVNGLKNVCQKKFSSVSSPSTDLDSSFWDTCACFLPTQYYNNYLENNNLEDKSLGTQECWFLPCSTASIQSQTNPQCPNNDVSNCIQKAYVTIKTNNTNNVEDNVIQTNQTIASCGTKSVSPILEKQKPPPTIPPPPSLQPLLSNGDILPTPNAIIDIPLTESPFDDIPITESPVIEQNNLLNNRSSIYNTEPPPTTNMESDPISEMTTPNNKKKLTKKDIIIISSVTGSTFLVLIITILAIFL